LVNQENCQDESLLSMKMENEENNVKLRKKLLIEELIFFSPHQIEFISEREPPDRLQDTAHHRVDNSLESNLGRSTMLCIC